MASNSEYGYGAGWMDAREMVYAAMRSAPNPEVTAALDALWESMGADVRQAKVEAYEREVGTHR